ncbi:MAG: YraN family protein [Propionibacteriaceae bacterium]|jgi:putative endonuclease|nr:YraN family protein [Propionibacteriaceae bacterium]
MNQNTSLGRLGESYVADCLTRQGWTIIERNWRFHRLGELDLVAIEPTADGPTLVFIEVKTRSGTSFGQPIDAVTPTKADRLYRLAGAWLRQRRVSVDRLRLDVVGVLHRPPDDWRLTHLRGVMR